jgi:L-rhamnose isomerase
MGMDFNPSYFSHPLASDGFTLSSADNGVRKFWIEHGIACRKIAEKIGKELGDTVITNFWMPDGMKDFPADRLSPRKRMADSLDKIFSVKINRNHNRDSVECKLFGIGSESYVVGSHEFFMGYAVKNKKLLCLDAGHFHPTEVISDKISSALLFVDEVLLHVSRGVRWDSDHVVLSDDATMAIMQEIVRSNGLDRVHIGMDFFDASINRIFAWVIGMRAARKSLLCALLDPVALMRKAENADDYGSRLALIEESRNLPASDVWEEYCARNDIPTGLKMIEGIKKYESDVVFKRK